MKICVTIVGVTRPSFERVRENLEANLAYFSTFRDHIFHFLLVTYTNAFSDKLREYCVEKGIESYFMDPIKDSDFLFPVRIPNAYRLFYSMSFALSKIKGDYDCVIRIRTDMEIKNLEIKDPVIDGVYYTVNSECGYTDNIGYGTPRVMKNVWKHENSRLPGTNMEDMVYKSIRKHGHAILPFRFHYWIHQSEDATFDGVPQWSRCTREWISDGKFIIKNK